MRIATHYRCPFPTLINMRVEHCDHLGDGIPTREEEGKSNVIPGTIVYVYFPFKFGYYADKRA